MTSGIPSCLCLNLRMATRAITTAYDEAMKPLGLRITQFSLLAGIAALGPVAMTTLADKLALDKTTLPRSLALLHKKGLLRFEPGEDKREKLVSLTPEGRKLLARGEKPWREVQERMEKALGEGGLAKTLMSLRRVRVAVRRNDEPVA